MAALKTASLVKESRLSGGGILAVYTVTTTATDDWFVIANMEIAQFAKAYTTADGTNQEAYTAGTDNKVYLDVAGTATVMVIGTSVKSTGGAT